MKSSIAIKSILSSFFSSLGLISWNFGRYSKNNFLLLMYHRVLPRQKVNIDLQAGMYVEPKTLEMHLRCLQENFKIISVSDLFSDSKGNFDISKNRHSCILTFDDGWRDFYEHAFPLLNAYQAPATIFLTTNFIGTKNRLWTDRLAHLFLEREKSKHSVTVNKLSANPLINRLEKLKGSRESKMEDAIEILKASRDDEIKKILSELSHRWHLEVEEPQGAAFLSWEEVREMKKSGIISYGSHTASHRILTTLTDEEISFELLQSKERLIAEKAVDPSFIPFCYPNGNYNEKIAGMAKEAGYTLAVTTENGWNDIGTDFFHLRRIAIHQDMTSTEAMFGCRVANIF